MPVPVSASAHSAHRMTLGGRTPDPAPPRCQRCRPCTSAEATPLIRPLAPATEARQRPPEPAASSRFPQPFVKTPSRPPAESTISCVPHTSHQPDPAHRRTSTSTPAHTRKRELAVEPPTMYAMDSRSRWSTTPAKNSASVTARDGCVPATHDRPTRHPRRHRSRSTTGSTVTLQRRTPGLRRPPLPEPTSFRAHLFPRWARSVLFRRSAVAGTGHGRHLEHGEAPGFPTPRGSHRQTGATTRHQAGARRAAPPRASCSNIDSNRATPTARRRPGTPAGRFQVGARATTPSTSADSARRAS